MKGLIRYAGLLVFLALYVLGLAVWSPLFLTWPRRYPSMTFGETVAARWVLVRHIWTHLVARAP